MKSMKKIVSMFCLAVLMLSLVACGGQQSTPAPGGDAAVTLRLSDHLSAEHGCNQMAAKFAELLEEKTAGSVKVEIYTDGQLGGQMENLEALTAGSVDMTIVDTGSLANYDPKIGILDMPYVFADFDQTRAVAEGEIGATLMGYVDAATEIRPVTIQPVLFRNTLLKDKAVTTPAEFKGVKVRIPENPSIEACFTALGATPVAIPSGEAYTAVQTGVTNGLEGNLEFIAQQKYYEVANTCSMTEHIMTFTAMCISNKAYDALSADQQAAFDAAAVEAMESFYPLYETIEADSRKVMEEGGVTFVEVDKEAMIAACAPTLEAFVAKNGLEDIYAAIKALS